MDDTAVDKQLLEKTVAGDADAFSRLYDRHAAKVMRVIFTILQDRQEAEDLVHDLFIEAWDKADRYSPERGSVLSWLMVRARSRAIDRKRKLRANGQHIEPGISIDDCDALVPIDRTLDAMAVRRALKQLTQLQYQVILQSYFQGLTYQQIADNNGVPMGTVKSRLAAAVNKLGQCFTETLEEKS